MCLYPTMSVLHQISCYVARKKTEQYQDKPFGSRAEKGHPAKSTGADKNCHFLFQTENKREMEGNQTNPL